MKKQTRRHVGLGSDLSISLYRQVVITFNMLSRHLELASEFQHAEWLWHGWTYYKKLSYSTVINLLDNLILIGFGN